MARAGSDVEAATGRTLGDARLCATSGTFLNSCRHPLLLAGALILAGCDKAESPTAPSLWAWLGDGTGNLSTIPISAQSLRALAHLRERPTCTYDS